MVRRAVQRTTLPSSSTPRAPRDRIDLGIRRYPETGRLTASRHEGLPASTEIAFLPVARSALGAPPADAEHGRRALAFLRCRLITGRLHQIRVHLAGVGLPIVGDPIYGEPRWKGIAEAGSARPARRSPARPCTRGI